MNKNKFDVIIIGGGVAGLSSALWCDELGLQSLVLESASELGGQLLWTHNSIENHLGIKTKNGRELRDIFVKQIEDRNFKLRLNSLVKSVDLENKSVDLENGETFLAKALIIATGIRRRKLGIEGEDKFQGKGIIQSGKRDKDLAQNKTAVIIGGGDAAFENTEILSETASKIFLIHRRKEFRAREEFIKQALESPKVEILTETVVKQIVGNEKVEAVELENKETKQSYLLPTNIILFRIGVEPNVDLFKQNLELDERGYIKINHNCETNRANIFAVGDVANPISPTVSSAVGMGATAVKNIYANLK